MRAKSIRMRLLVLLALVLSVALPLAGAVAFNKDVLPILSDKCFVCHGPDAAAKKIPFRLDSEAAARPKLSEIARRVAAENPAMRMPPVYSGLSLSAHEIETLRTWVAEGAPWQQHWSFIPPEKPALPETKNKSWGRTPIDAFVLERLEKEGLKPSPEASREKLLRRVSFDLTGLPPSPAELDSFLKDDSPRAYEKVVDRLLASPRYGERMAARWMDAARYADSNGYQYDAERIMWRWRDWVIDSFNRNQPFNRFTVEQLAGDLLPNATLPQKIATGFNRNHRANTEDGIIAEEYAVEYVVDRVETTSTVFMGVTLGCARCHNHKYDPVYAEGVLSGLRLFQQRSGTGPRDEIRKLAADDRRAHRLAAACARPRLAAEDPNAANCRWNGTRLRLKRRSRPGKPSSVPGYRPALGAIPNRARSELRPPLRRQSRFRNLRIRAASISKIVSPSPRWMYSEGEPDGSLMSRMENQPKGKGYGVHLDHGKVHVNLTSNWVNDAIRVVSEETLAPRRWYKVTVTYSGSRMAEGVHVYIDGKPAKLKVEHDTLYRPFRNAGKSCYRTVSRWAEAGGRTAAFSGPMDDVRVYRRVLTEGEIALALGFAETVAACRKGPHATAISSKTPVRRTFAPPGRQLLQARLEKERSGAVLSHRDGHGRSSPRATTLLCCSAELITCTATRWSRAFRPCCRRFRAARRTIGLGFATWLVDRKNPLLARVTVNRFWQMYFGTGIVKTTEDFGRRASGPRTLNCLTGWQRSSFRAVGM